MPRTQTKIYAIIKKLINLNLFLNPPKKIQTNSIDMNKILVYSASITKAKPPLLYSVLYPDTNSDSPSAKSNGVRFVSAKQETKNIKATTGNKKINHNEL